MPPSPKESALTGWQRINVMQGNQVFYKSSEKRRDGKRTEVGPAGEIGGLVGEVVRRVRYQIHPNGSYEVIPAK